MEAHDSVHPDSRDQHRDSIDVQRAEELYSLPKHVLAPPVPSTYPNLQFLLLLPPPSKLCLPAAAVQVHSTYLSSNPSQPGNPFLATPKRLNRVLQKSQVWESGVSINQSRMAHQSVSQSMGEEWGGATLDRQSDTHNG